MKRLLTTTAFIFVATSSLLAADLGVKKPSPLPAFTAFSWTGFYVGVQAGYHFGEVKHSNAALGAGIPIGVPGFAAKSNPNGFVGGLHAGYNYQINQIVIGAEGDIEYTGGRDSGNGQTAPLLVVAKSETRWQGSLRLRAGLAIDRTLVYITGGAAFRDSKFSYSVPAAPATASFTSTRTGWTVGAGVEHAFTYNWTARLEYRYSDFGVAKGTLVPIQNAPAQHRAKVTDHAVRAGISYKF